MRLGSDVASGEVERWRVFISHTGELREFPRGGSYIAEVERAVSAAGHVIVDMADFPAIDLAPAHLCIDRVQSCEVYLGVFGTRYGSPVRDRPTVSYTELEFDTATDAKLERLVFMLDPDAADVGIPLSNLIDRQFGDRQDTFKARVQDSGLTTQRFAGPGRVGAAGGAVPAGTSRYAQPDGQRPTSGTDPRGAAPGAVIEVHQPAPGDRAELVSGPAIPDPLVSPLSGGAGDGGPWSSAVGSVRPRWCADY